MEKYGTISGVAKAETEVKKSRFIAEIRHVESAEEADSYVRQVRTAHREARHVAYAYRVFENEILLQKSSDDGEPSGTAGIPILEAITGNGLYDVVITVTRYFGGILLGASGLGRAYSAAANAAVGDAKPAVTLCCDRLGISVGYGAWERLKPALDKEEIYSGGVEYGELVDASFFVPSKAASAISGKISEITCGQAIIREYGRTHITADLRGNFLSIRAGPEDKTGGKPADETVIKSLGRSI
ncbi:MAG: YigZ family protein [Eubacteriales bacterium]|nr:YigZ family protein [Eubacteriales bacterium]